MLNSIKNFLDFPKKRALKCLQQAIIPCNSYKELMRLWHWKKTPDLAYLGNQPLDYHYPEDLNDRALHDAEVLMTLACNIGQTAVLEIGTSTGLTTLGFSINSPTATIYTVDIPREEAQQGKGGKLITHILDPNDVGYHYKREKVKNVHQIFANTATWKPDLPQLDLAFIDGCHDREFVVNDIRKILPYIKPGGFIAWHDANPELIYKYHWIQEVCTAIGDLILSKHIKGNLYFIKDSWITIYKVN